MLRLACTLGATSLLALAGCAVVPPPGPSVMALPGQTKSFEAFLQDDAVCRQYALQLIGNVSPATASTQSAFGSAAVGTLLGAAEGALIGVAAGNPAAGAAIGSATGLLVGSAAGATAARISAGEMQRVYDSGYAQCMTAKGESSPQALPSYAYGPAVNFYGYPYPYPSLYARPYPAYYYGPGMATVGFGYR